MGSRCSKMETSTPATGSTDMGESSFFTNKKVSACIKSFWKETIKSIKVMNGEYDQRCHKSDVWGDIARNEIKRVLRPVLQDGINEDQPNSETKISKWKRIKAWQKEQFQGKGKGLVTKFFRVLRKLGKNYKKMAKKVKNYAKDFIKNKNIDWKRVTRLIFLIAVIAVLTCAIIAFFSSPATASLGVSLAAVVLSFFSTFQTWFENQFKEDEKKNHGKKKSGSTAWIKLGKKNGDFADRANTLFQKFKKAVKKFIGASKELRQLANCFKRMLKGGRKVIQNMKKEVKNKAS